MGEQFAEAFFSQDPGSRHHTFLMFLSDHAYSIFRQVTDNAFHITAHIADFCEFRRFHLDKGSIDELCKTSCNLSLSNACRSDHQDILGNDLVPKSLFNPAAAIAVSERNSNSFLGFILTNDKSIQLVNDLPRCQLLFIHIYQLLSFQTVSTVMFSFV